jgi:DNA-binding LacI/PurR family transcriptional regulator
MEQNGIAYDESLVVELDEFTPEAGAAAIERLVASGLPFDGVFCVTDYVALGVLRALADAGVDVPGSVKVIGFDDVEFSRFLVPSLSSVNPDHDLMARTAVELLAARIEDNDHEAVEFVSPFRIVERASTGASARA